MRRSRRKFANQIANCVKWKYPPPDGFICCSKVVARLVLLLHHSNSEPKILHNIILRNLTHIIPYITYNYLYQHIIILTNVMGCLRFRIWFTRSLRICMMDYMSWGLTWLSIGGDSQWLMNYTITAITCEVQVLRANVGRNNVVWLILHKSKGRTGGGMWKWIIRSLTVLVMSWSIILTPRSIICIQRLQ